MSEETPPFVSVVTPFFNSGQYLEQCIESVLRQSHAHFEYVLLDNCSSDQSQSIAERYAARDSRIRLVRAGEFREQVENYNFGLSLIGRTSRYCKIVQADDWIFPGCLEAMVDVAERDRRIGIVGAYSLRGKSLRGEGLPVETWRVEGRQAGRMQILDGVFFTGSPTTIMYRADLVRQRQPFYEPGRYHEDTEVAYEILREHDLGFVHQVLSYQRVDDDSIMGRRSSYAPHLLDRLIVLERFGKNFLSADELAEARRISEQMLFHFLGNKLLRGREPAFWQYQKEGFRLMGRPWPRLRVLASAINQVLNVALNPKIAIHLLLSRLRKVMRNS